MAGGAVTAEPRRQRHRPSRGLAGKWVRAEIGQIAWSSDFWDKSVSGYTLAVTKFRDPRDFVDFRRIGLSGQPSRMPVKNSTSVEILPEGPTSGAALFGVGPTTTASIHAESEPFRQVSPRREFFTGLLALSAMIGFMNRGDVNPGDVG